MSRLIFLNLPASLTPDSFRAQLISPPSLKDTAITDVKLVPKRRFAFVGYKTDDEAKRVKDWFDGTFSFGGVKIKVDFVRDEPMAPAPDKKVRAQAPPKEETAPAVATGSNKRLEEFMNVMKGVDTSATSIQPTTSATGAVPGEEGWTVDGMHSGKKEKESRKGKEKSVEMEVEEVDDDAEWLKRRQVTLDEDNNAQAGPSVPVKIRSNPEEDLILSTGRLFVRNLAFVTSSAELQTLFSTYGPTEEIHLPTNKLTGEPIGTAFVLFTEPEHALAAYKGLDKSAFQGRLLHVLPGRNKPGQERNSSGVVDGKVLGKAAEGRGAVKQGVDERRKNESSKGVNWASLYMNSDAVAASVADRMGISKSELLNGDDGNAAVKLALAETHVIQETKKYFEDEGIVIDSLEPRVPRSQTTILVKNIPYGTTITTLTDLFSPHGTISRILLPPAGTLGVVEFSNPIEAGRAFKALSYRRLGNSPLYLEKGPIGMFKQTPEEKLKSVKQKEVEEANALAEKVATTRDVPDVTDEAGSTLFLKNLSFATTSERLVTVLSSLAGFSFARVQMKPDPKRENAKLSMGYGFVGFKTKQEANKALAGLEGLEIDGKIIEVKFAQRGIEEDRNEDKDKKSLSGKTKSTKILVKNLAFEVTKKDIKELFSAYGQLKSLRLPKKPTGLSTSGSASTRGFAFAEFTTHAEALSAMEALKHTHLLGRHLVLEWAKEGDKVDVEGLREKVGRDWRSKDGGERKKRKLDLGGEAVDELDGLDG